MKTILFDIETSPNLAYVWNTYEQDVIAFDTERYLLCFSYKVLGEKKITTVSLPDFPRYRKNPDDDREVVKELWNVFNEADILVAHNGDKFDVKMARAFFARHQLPPPSPFKTIDTVKVARDKFRFNSNKLNDLGEYLHLGKKIETGGFSLWRGCLSGDKKSWALMKKYCAQDVLLLEKVYLTLRPWMTNHPNVNALEGRPHACPKCGNERIQARGTGCNQTRVFTRYQCQNCAGWFQSIITEKSGVTTK